MINIFPERLKKIELVLFYAVMFLETDQFAVTCYPALEEFMVCCKY